MWSDASFRRGLRTGAPLIPVMVGFGAVFGVLAVQAGLATWLTILVSLIVVSGAAQFTLIALLDSGAAAVLIATTGLALRHVPMSASLGRLVGHEPLATRLRLAWVLVDETFGLTITAAARGIDNPAAYKSALDLELYSGWVTGTVFGALVGGDIDPTRWGFDVLFPLMFLGLAAPLVRSKTAWTTVAVAVVASLAAVAWLPPAWQITSAATVAALVGTVVRD